jgi:hypothetical protein
VIEVYSDSDECLRTGKYDTDIYETLDNVIVRGERILEGKSRWKVVARLASAVQAGTRGW